MIHDDIIRDTSNKDIVNMLLSGPVKDAYRLVHLVGYKEVILKSQGGKIRIRIVCLLE